MRWRRNDVRSGRRELVGTSLVVAYCLEGGLEDWWLRERERERKRERERDTVAAGMD